MARALVWLVVGMLAAASVASAQVRDVGAMITEIKAGRGRIEVRGPGASEWRPAGPLLALKVGDSLRATEDAAAVVVLAGRGGTVQVDAASSPFVVTAAPAESKLQKAFLLLEGGLGFLGSNPRETPKPVLSTRTTGRPPVILSPRTGPVMPDSLQFEWQGYQFARYTLRVSGPSGIVLERPGVTGSRFAYPSEAPPLVPGAAYTLELYSGQTRVDASRFEVADRQRVDDVRRDLREIDQALGPSVPPSSRAVVQAGFLASRGFLHDARAVVVTALVADSDQPSLHELLGDLYARTGLQREADEAHDQARLLVTDPPRR
ncbi:MAG TPA: hypothetical protein VID28_24285 [Methylomirabilota bacterium]|jgi:hypothetical protein